MKYFILFITTFFIVQAASCQQNNSRGVISEEIPASDFEKKIRLAGVVLVDVRTPEEFKAGHIEGARNINYNDPSFAVEIKKLDTTKTALLYCLAGSRSGDAMPVFTEAGFKKIYNLKGGTMKWTAEGFPLVNNEKIVKSQGGITETEYLKLTTFSEIVIIDFNAAWCQPCKKLAPILEQAENNYKGRLKVVKLDVDQNKSIAASKHIDGIPFLEIYKNGKLTMQHEGLISYEELIKLLPL